MHGRLIDADALLRDIEHYHVSDGKMQYWVEIQPTVDDVPVVRCKDCKHYTPYVDYYDGKTYNQGVCKHYNQILFDNNFCSFGVRKDEENG